MSARGKQLVLVALFAALGVGVLLYSLSRPATPRQVVNPLSATWWDDFDNSYRIDKDDGVFCEDGSVRLSHVHDLGSPVAGASRLERFALAADGRLFGVAQVDAELHLFVYDPNTTQMSDLGVVALRANVWSLAIGLAQQEIYAGLSCWDRACDGHLLVYNLQSRQARHAYLGFAGNRSIVGNLVVASDGTVYGTVDAHIFSYTPGTDHITDLGIPADEWEDVQGLVLGADGNLYGFTDHEGWFKYELASGQITWILRWSKYRDRWLGEGANGALYLLDEDNKLLYAYDPISGSLVETRVDLEGLSLIGFDGDNSMYIDDWENLVRYNVAQDARVVLEDLRDYCCSEAVDTAGHVYLGRNGYETYYPLVESPLRTIYRIGQAQIVRRLPPWAAGWLPTLQPVGGYQREYHPARLAVYQADTFRPEGVFTSRPIEPHPLMITYTEASDLGLVSALAWGGDGMLYGVAALGCP